MSRIDELWVFMSSSKAGWYLQIYESKLDSTVLDVEVYIPGFEIVSWRKESRNGGGVCTHVRTNLNYRIRNDLIILIATVRKNRAKSWFRGKSWKIDFFHSLSIDSFSVDKKPLCKLFLPKAFYLQEKLGCRFSASESRIFNLIFRRYYWLNVNFPRIRKQRRTEKFRHFPSTEQIFFFHWKIARLVELNRLKYL